MVLYKCFKAGASLFTAAHCASIHPSIQTQSPAVCCTADRAEEPSLAGQGIRPASGQRESEGGGVCRVVCEREGGSCLESCAGQRATLGRPWNVSSQLFSRGAIPSQAYPLLEPEFQCRRRGASSRVLNERRQALIIAEPLKRFSFHSVRLSTLTTTTTTPTPSCHHPTIGTVRISHADIFIFLSFWSPSNRLPIIWFGPNTVNCFLKRDSLYRLVLCAGPIELVCVVSWSFVLRSKLFRR
jgi:hypothetical protein